MSLMMWGWLVLLVLWIAWLYQRIKREDDQIEAWERQQKGSR